MKITATRNTFLKPSTQDTVQLSPMLDPNSLIFLDEGEVIEVPRVSRVGSHLALTYKGNTWYVYINHVKCEQPWGVIPHNSRGVVLPVPYFSQRDNKNEPHRTCNSSAHAMALAYLKPGLISGDDDYWNRYVNGVGDTTDWAVHDRAFNNNGIASTFSTTLTPQVVKEQIDNGYPTPIGLLHRGSISNPTGGHVVTVIGYHTDTFICHDPWGAGFSYEATNGKSVKYPLKPSLNARWLADGPGSGWGRLYQL